MITVDTGVLERRTQVQDLSLSARRQRIVLLDVLRGVALFGMLLVHATYYVNGGGALGAAVLGAVHFVAETTRSCRSRRRFIRKTGWASPTPPGSRC